MLFNSFDFAVFFPVVTLIYFALPYRFRTPWLLAASCFFYMVFIPEYILILFLTIAIDYAAGLAIARGGDTRRRLWLVASICANVGVLAVFKYSTFIDANLQELARFLHWNYSTWSLSLILPLGLSFHTFQAMSYTIEVYRGRVPAERNLATFALYVLFYPQLVAGPIERPQNLLPQLKASHDPDDSRMIDGLQLMAWGFFKKLVIADRLALVVNRVYGDTASFGGPALALATVFFAWQIYADFSGYADIAIGSAQVMGFRLTPNFRRPYFADSIEEFWRRWHISLSSWFRDYVYIPLGGNRVSRLAWTFNIMATFLLSGLWHGANWTYVCWGALHGGYLVVGKTTRAFRSRLASAGGLDRMPGVHRMLRTATVFTLVTFAWIFFRARSASEAVDVVRRLPFDWGTLFTRGGPQQLVASMGTSMLQLTLSVALVLVLALVQIGQSRVRLRTMIAGWPAAQRWTVYYAGAIALLCLGASAESPFIYFQF